MIRFVYTNFLIQNFVYLQNSESKNSSTPCHKCPVCNSFTSFSSEKLTEHVESHFSASTTSPVSPDITSDKLIAHKLSITDQETLQIQQQKEFEFLQVRFDSYQYVFNYERAFFQMKKYHSLFRRLNMEWTTRAISKNKVSKICKKLFIPVNYL